MSCEDRDTDLVVIGGGPAGSAAAIAGCRSGLRTLLIERRAEPPAAVPCPGWLGPAAARTCRDCGVDLGNVGTPFTGLRLWPWDLGRCAEIDDAELQGWIVNPAALAAALLAAARAAGAQILQPATATDLSLGETATAVTLADGRRVEGRVAVIADGAASGTARAVPLSFAVGDGVAGAQAVLSTRHVDPGLDVILGAGRSLRVTTIARGGRHVRVSLLTHDLSTPATAQLEAVIEAARAADLVPRDAHGKAAPTPAIAGAALEFDAHVGKRCLLVGDAGGFVSAFSHEGLYPALRSGWLAAEVAARALMAPVLQDELAGFSSVWRSDLANYLRMPNTDLGLLLPMVFTNPQMSRRIARAFLLGQAF